MRFTLPGLTALRGCVQAVLEREQAWARREAELAERERAAEERERAVADRERRVEKAKQVAGSQKKRSRAHIYRPS